MPQVKRSLFGGTANREMIRGVDDRELVNRINENELVEDYERFRELLDKKDITTDRLDWQPQVMLERNWSRNGLFDLMKQLKNYPELNINLAVEMMAYKDYMGDIRYARESFARIEEPNEYNPLLYVFYPRSYNANSLSLEMESLEKPYTMLTGLRFDLINEVRGIFYRYWPDYYMKFIPYGSQMSGLAFPKSALNICVEMDEPDLNRLVERQDAMSQDRGEPYCTDTLMDVIDRYGGQKFTYDKALGSIRFKLDTQTIEFNFNKEIFTESTNLIDQYMQMDSRVEPFLYAIKIFGRGRNIFASQVLDGIRYYGYTVMALAYLAQLDPPVIPDLQHINHTLADDDCFVDNCRSKQKYWDTVVSGNEYVGIAARYHNCVQFNGNQPGTAYHVAQDSTTGKLYWNSKNDASVGELFLDFLHYYGYRFDYDTYAVSLKFGGRTAKKAAWRHNSLAIEDPFMAMVNLGAPVRDRRKVQDVFRGSFSILHSGICFEILHKKIAEIVRYDAPRGVNGDRPEYHPLPSYSLPATSKSFLLIDLPKIEDPSCYCVRINNLFASHGTIDNMLDLDSTTKQVFFTADNKNAKDIVLPSSFLLDGQTVHLVELYDYTNPYLSY